MVGVFFTEPMPAVVGYIRFSQTCILRHERLAEKLDQGLETQKNPGRSEIFEHLSIAVLYTHKLGCKQLYIGRQVTDRAVILA